MGRPRIKVMDDSQVEVKEKTSTRPSSGGKKVKTAKSEADKASSEVEPTTEPKTSAEKNQTSEAKVVVDDSAVKPQSEEKVKTESSKKQKPGKAKPRSKKYQEVIKDLDRTKTYSLEEAIDLVKKLSYSQFNGTLEAHINTAQTGIRSLVSLPFVAGKKLRILAFGTKTPEGVTAGDDTTIDTISKGKVDFDLIITTPEWMPKLAKVAKILGPKDLMPNPKNGTITEDLKKAVEGFQSGKTEYKTEAKTPVIHLALGKLNQPNEELVANTKTLLQTLGKSKVKKVSLSPTMGPSVKINLTSL